MTIDWWTLGLQAVNVMVLVWLLAHFFWKPVSAMIEQRRVAAQQSLLDAQARQAEAAAALADIARTRAGLAQEREAILLQAHADADRLRAARLQQAQAEADAATAAAAAALARDRQAVEQAWQQRAGTLAVDIAGRLCAPLAGPTLQTAFVDRLVARLAALSLTERQTMAESALALDVVSALPLAPDEQERCRRAVAQAFGALPRLSFDTDATLLAGVELRSPHVVVHNSWSADLRQIQTELAHDAA